MTFNISSMGMADTLCCTDLTSSHAEVLEHNTMNIIGEFHSYKTIPTINTALTVLSILHHWLYAQTQGT